MFRSAQSATGIGKRLFRLWIAGAIAAFVYGLWRWIGHPDGQWHEGVPAYVIACLLVCAAFSQQRRCKKPIAEQGGEKERLLQVSYNFKDCLYGFVGSLLSIALFAASSFFFFEAGNVIETMFSLLLLLLFSGYALFLLPRIKNREFLVFLPEGISLRAIGFVAWRDVDIISISSEFVIIFRAVEERVASVPFWIKRLRRLQQKDGRVLMRYSLASLDQDAVSFYAALRRHYADHLSAGRMGCDAPAEEIDNTLQQAPDHIRFLTDTRTALNMFQTQHIS